MKKIVIVVVVLVALLVVAPWGVGRLAEKRLDHGLDKLVEAAPYLKVVERKWTGGWFKSEQVVTFEVSGAWVEGAEPEGDRRGHEGRGRRAAAAMRMPKAPSAAEPTRRSGRAARLAGADAAPRKNPPRRRSAPPKRRRR